MTQPAISVIVPIYKAEKYIHRCIDSLLAQTFTDFELLLIDDGSPDNSGHICDEYAAKDNRVRVFHKENGGVSSARQCGIVNAVGEYTIHADPDDWVEPDMLEELYAKAKEEDADMVICDFYEDKRNCSKVVCQNPKTHDSDVIMRKLLFQQLHGSCWNKLIKLVCYKQNQIKFPENIIRWEDLFVVCEILRHGCRVTYLNKAFYHYDTFSNTNSIIRKVSSKGVESQINFVNHFSALLDYKMYSEELYTIKAKTKELAFSSSLFSEYEILMLYADINSKYCSINKNKPLLSLSRMLSISLYYKSSYSLMYKLYKITQPVADIIKHIIEK